MQIIRNIKTSMSEANLVMTKADKGNSVVILNRDDYVSKCDAFLNNNDFEVMTKDPTTKFQNQLKATVAKCGSVLSAADKWKLFNMNPLPPRFFGLPKTHKPNIPIRPVVSHFTAPCHKLSVKLNSLLRNYSSFQSKFSIKNAVDLVTKISTVQPPHNSKLISFDVTNLFTSVPAKEASTLAVNLIKSSGGDEKMLKEIKLLLDLCIEQNYFLFNGKFYKQSSGLAMGSPLSPILAEIFMNEFEHKLFDCKHPLLSNICYWYRYVDDIICLWTGTLRQLNTFMSFINSLHQSIEFTLEYGGHKINFLDLNIDISTGKHEFSIYRKPTFTDVIIPINSNHHRIHKTASLKSMVNRLTSISMSQDNFNKELNTIKYIAQQNGFDPKLIDKLIERSNKKQAINFITSIQADTENPSRWCKLPFIPHLSYKLSNIIQNAKVSFYNPLSVGKILFNTKDKYDDLQKCGVYQLKCDNCETKYIGQTGRNFNVRMKEHRRCFLNNDESSGIAKHLCDENHWCNFEPKILHCIDKGRKMDFLEQFEIVNCPTKLCNDHTFPSQSPLLHVTLPSLLESQP